MSLTNVLANVGTPRFPAFSVVTHKYVASASVMSQINCPSSLVVFGELVGAPACDTQGMIHDATAKYSETSELE